MHVKTCRELHTVSEYKLEGIGNPNIGPGVIGEIGGENYLFLAKTAESSGVGQTSGDSGTSINQITVADTLNRMGKLYFCGGVSYLSHLISICGSPFDAFFYAEIVKRGAIARQIIEAGRIIQKIGFSNPVDISAALSECDDKITNVRKCGIYSPIISPKVRASAQFDRYTEMQENQKTIGIGTGITALDRILGGGFYPGTLNIAAGRAGLGKTTFLSHVANEACHKGITILFCSAEMDVDSITDREVAQHAGVPINRIRRGNYSQKLYEQIQEAIAGINDKPMWFYGDTPMTTDRILQHAIALKLRNGLGMLLIDYLGILDDQYGRNSYERITYISRQLKQMSRILQIPVVVAAQLNRESAKRDDKRPELSDLRDSGAIEQDADTVLMLHRDNFMIHPRKMMTPLKSLWRRIGKGNQTELSGLDSIRCIKPTSILRKKSQN